MWPSFTSFIALGASFVAFGAVDSVVAVYSMCGSKATGATKCPSNLFCQPRRDDAPYLCLPLPLQCAHQMPNISFSGENLVTFANVTSSVECCDKCDGHHGCIGYNFFYNSDKPRKSMCYLKGSVVAVATIYGAVSAKLD